MRRLLKAERVLWAVLLGLVLLVGGAEAQSNATIIRALNRFLNQPHTWTQVQTFLLGTATTAGTGLTVARPGGVIFTGNTTGTCNVASLANVGTGETDLCSYTMLGGTLGVNLQKVRITTWLTTAANVNNKTVRLYFGATLGAQSAATALNAGTFRLNALVLRTGTATQISVGEMMASSTGAGFVSGLGLHGTPAETLTGPVTIRVTGQSATAGGDVTLQAMTVEWLPQ